MKILAIDTSSKAASCAVLEDGFLRCEYFINAGLTHSQTIMPMVESMLKAAEVKLSQIDLFAVSAGPGSFTGLRIGIASIKGIAMAAGKPCVGVSTLEALAYNHQSFAGYILPVMDARRQQVYTALFYSNARGKIERVWSDDAISILELKAKLAEFKDKPIIMVGDGVDVCKEELAADNIIPSTEILRYQRASGTAVAAIGKPQVSPQELEPIYIRLPQAERELKLKTKG